MLFRIQIAGVRDEAEARMLVEEGVDDLGFPLGPGVVTQDLSEADAGRIIRALEPPAFGVVITYLDRAREILELCARTGTRKVQLHGEISHGELALLDRLAPDLQVLKSLVVRADNSNELERQVADLSPFVDFFITDTYDPSTGQRGATGKVHDWEVSRRLVELSPRPVILAGGLNAENVAAAVLCVKPAGVDSHTGVEAPDGRKDRAKVRRFVQAARDAFSKWQR